MNVEAISEKTNYFKGNQFKSIREEIVLNGKIYLAVSTDFDLYLLDDQNIMMTFNLNEEAIFIEVVIDVNGNGFDELLIMTNSKERDNILLYDTLDQELIYKYASKMRAYNSGEKSNVPIGYYDEYVVVLDYILIDHHFYGIAGYNAFSINLKEQKEVWEYQAENNLWAIEAINDINQDQIVDVVVSLQKKDIIALSGVNGAVIYQKYVSEPVRDERDLERTTSIWNMQYDDETNILYAASENGKVYKMDASTGKVVDKKVVSEVIIDIQYGHYNSHLGQSHFKMYSIELIDDITGDGIKDLIYYQMLRPIYYQKTNHGMNEEIIILIDGATLSILDEKIPLIMDFYGYNYIRGNYKGESVFYILLVDNNQTVLTYQIFSLSERKYLTETISVTTNRNKIDPNSFSIYMLENGDIGVFSNRHLNIQKDNMNTKSIPIIKAQDYLLDGNRLLLMQGINLEGGLHQFEMVDILTDQSLWSVNLEENLNSIQVDYTYDFNGDGIKDVVILNVRGEDNIEKKLPWVMFIDGESGQMTDKIYISLDEADIVNTEFPDFEAYLQHHGYYMGGIISYGSYSDVNDDGNGEYYVTNNLGDLYIIDFINEQITNYYSPNDKIVYQSENHFADIVFTGVKKINDIDNDSLDDFIILKSKSNLTTLYSIKTNDFTFLVEEIANYSNSNILDNYKMGDIDFDGISDLAFTMYNKQQATFHVISSITGLEIVNINCGTEDIFYLSDEDINGDQLKELYQISQDMQRWEGSMRLLDVSDNNINVLFTSSPYRYMYNLSTPAVTFKDNGQFYIALNVRSSEQENAILIYDILSNDLIHELKIGNEKQSDFPYFGSIQVINDGEAIYFYPKTSEYSGFIGERSKSYLYDYNEKQVNFYYPNVAINHLDIVNQQLFIKGSNHQVIKTTFKQYLEFDNLQDNQLINKHINLIFKNKQEGNVYIYVDNELVGITKRNEYALKILEGKHTISISQINDLGIETMDTIHVEVTKNYFFMITVIISTIGLFTAGIILPHRKKSYPLPTGLKGSGDVC